MASLFRRPAAEADPSRLAGGTAGQLHLGAELPSGRPAGTTRPGTHVASPTAAPSRYASGQEPARTTARLGASEPPPVLPKSYPHSDPLPSLQSEPPARADPPAENRGKDSVALHTIVDGDTLPALAKRYCGRTDGWVEIFDANREILTSPEVLPIGARLRIPLGTVKE